MLIITGAAGFIGSNLAVQLASMGHDLWLVDHPLTPAKAMNLVGLQKFTFIEHQAFLRLLDSELPPCEGVFHRAVVRRKPIGIFCTLTTSHTRKRCGPGVRITIAPSCMLRVRRRMATAPMGLMIVPRRHNCSH